MSEGTECRLDQSKLPMSEFNPTSKSLDNSQCRESQSEEEAASIRDRLARLIAKGDLQGLELYAQGVKGLDLNSLVSSPEH